MVVSVSTINNRAVHTQGRNIGTTPFTVVCGAVPPRSTDRSSLYGVLVAVQRHQGVSSLGYAETRHCGQENTLLTF